MQRTLLCCEYCLRKELVEPPEIDQSVREQMIDMWVRKLRKQYAVSVYVCVCVYACMHEVISCLRMPLRKQYGVSVYVCVVLYG